MISMRSAGRVLLVGLIVTFTAAALARELTVEQRVNCQRAVEDVYWAHRIWPAANPALKPVLTAVLSEDALRAKVQTSLRESAALAMWGRPIMAEALQAEMDRMARQTHRPEVLGEIVAALHGDPYLVAECLARPILADQGIGELADRDAAFADWWKEEGPSLPVEIASSPDIFTPVPLQSLSACANDTWTPTTLTHAPLGRFGHATLWTGSEVLVYGGVVSFGGHFNSGGIYDPATDSWRVLPLAPSSSEGGTRVTVVWTGTKMISWGGGFFTQFDEGDFDQGGRYDPAANTWLATSMDSGLPSARENHSAVWTGSRMIVWGGHDTVTDSDLDTGGVYDPAADDWKATSTGGICSGSSHAGHGCQSVADCPGSCSGGANPGDACTSPQDCLGGCDGNPAVHCAGNADCASQGLGKCASPPPGACGGTGTCPNTGYHPSARAGHTAIWTGTRMVIWGGDGNTGGRYDPATDTWTPTSTGANVPARQSAPGVWTGAEMIVWGGTTGGRYDPVNDQWSPMSLTGAPVDRVGATSVWTGDEMIVWGGPPTGGRYRPATNTWTPTSTGANVPSARTRHSAAWTGSEMVVWGGAPDTNTGGRYCATPACTVATWYHDADGDGYGLTSVSVLACAQPAGYAAAAGDCDDAAAGVHPGIAEVCGDGLDNDCDGIADDAGALAGSSTMSVTAAGGGNVSWTPIAGANAYDVVRGSLGVLAAPHGDFTVATGACLGSNLLATSTSDAATPAAGQGYWYVVRGENCAGAGTFDSGQLSQVGSRDAEIQASGHSCP